MFYVCFTTYLNLFFNFMLKQIVSWDLGFWKCM